MTAHYAYNTRDLKFILKEWLPLEEIFAYDTYKEYYDVGDIDMVIDQFDKVAGEKIAPSNDEGEESPARLEDGVVRVPKSYRALYKYVQENGWGTSNIDEGNGGLPFVITCAANEFMVGASPSFMPYVGITTGAARLIYTFGDERHKRMFLPKIFGGDWSGTMCLTEANAGSDVGDIQSKAYPTGEEGVYRIKGAKMFVTGGDGDHAENVIHLFLARIEGARPGTKGISLFIVPKLWVNGDGSLESNDVIPTSVEHKLGQMGSSTVALACGDDDNCRGWLLGEYDAETGAGQGMAQMFQMMNEERLFTGSAALGVAAVAYRNAAAYCKERIQGRPITDPRGERVRLVDHEDIRRILMLNKATLEACRAIVNRTGYYIEVGKSDPDPERRKFAEGMADCLTPIAKAYPSDEAWGLICESLQAYGGYGYTEEYPAARAARDVKIYSIWEGTNYIQAMDLLGRKRTMGKGSVFAAFLKVIEDFIAANSPFEGFEKEMGILDKAFTSYKAIMGMIENSMKEGKPGMTTTFATRIQTATAQLYGGMCLLEQALIAKRRIEELGEDHYDYNFYNGKLLSAQYYLRNVVPNVWAVEEIVRDGDTSVTDATPETFDY
jgi:alkylation response protein AidB-like acyl-CoA dehydrogenase